MTSAPPHAALPKPTFTDPRMTSIEVHRHLRSLILDNTLAPGTILKQSTLARDFGVSRTPLREAFRMLQEEGLIEADLNQRGRVKALDPAEVDQLYGARIAMESLGVRITTGNLTDAELQRGEALLLRLEELHDQRDMDAWGVIHRQFHAICIARAEEPLARTIQSYSERSERYLRLYQVWHPRSFATAHEEHVAILRAVRGRDPHRAGTLMANHLARTALNVLHDLSPDMEARAVAESVSMVTGGQSKSTAEPRLD